MTDPRRLRFAVCDDENQYTGLIETMLAAVGHEVIGVATSAAAAVALVDAARPDVVILDLSMDFNSDFDVLATAVELGIKVVVFSQRADEAILSRYAVRPTVVYKPDLVELERIVRRLGPDERVTSSEQDRRNRPSRSAEGPEPTGPTDSQAFYEALNAAAAGDALVAIELGGQDDLVAAADAAVHVRSILRSTDRLLQSPRSLRVFLPAGGGDAIASFLARLQEDRALPDGTVVRQVVVASEESPMDAFERLKGVVPSPLPPRSL